MPRELSVFILESDHATEVHGIGETAVPPVRPAIANAISRAIGLRLYDLPITPEKVLQGLRAGNQSLTADSLSPAATG
jgi:CO/xanthine dehydrogenase Mo-binding subunit